MVRESARPRVFFITKAFVPLRLRTNLPLPLSLPPLPSFAFDVLLLVALSVG